MTHDNALEVALLHVADKLRSLTHVVWLTGAGLSVASGIPPYRRSKDAVWSQFLTEWGTIARFHQSPVAWYREFWLKAHSSLFERAGGIRPNAGHDAITRIVKAHPMHSVITQNIDGLHRKSGVADEQLVEIHGRHDHFVCSNERCSRAREPVGAPDLSCIAHGEAPECDFCGAPVRPLVLLFDETYDSHPAYRMRQARTALNDAEVVMFVGTSFAVGITDYALRAARHAHALLVNANVEPVVDLGPEMSGVAPDAFVELLGPAEAVLPRLAHFVLA